MPDLADEVLAHITRIGGGVTITELVYQTRRPPTDVLEALVDLEEQGRATAASWTTIDQAANEIKNATRSHAQQAARDRLIREQHHQRHARRHQP